ncbi:hypothetical protein E2562_007789 [Oryza meyeriana var. granulata]|uniref:Uncharacterized protein n=1 Tax=Oryza meyeriana var. granulata TaxID=110450 RepID=A0A6G1EGV9_9ORYZ|nr:hypothetical protein E2562_007789 [Oryza meyeriana var. granulata]
MDASVMDEAERESGRQFSSSATALCRRLHLLPCCPSPRPLFATTAAARPMAKSAATLAGGILKQLFSFDWGKEEEGALLVAVTRAGEGTWQWRVAASGHRAAADDPAAVLLHVLQRMRHRRRQGSAVLAASMALNNAAA